MDGESRRLAGWLLGHDQVVLLVVLCESLSGFSGGVPAAESGCSGCLAPGSVGCCSFTPRSGLGDLLLDAGFGGGAELLPAGHVTSRLMSTKRE